MTTRMTPMRWLHLIGFATALYVSSSWATALDGVWNVPPQVNSVFLTAFATAAIIAARAERDRRGEERTRKENAERDAEVRDQLNAICEELGMRTPTAPTAAPDNVIAFELGRQAERQAERNSNGKPRNGSAPTLLL